MCSIYVSSVNYLFLFCRISDSKPNILKEKYISYLLFSSFFSQFNPNKTFYHLPGTSYVVKQTWTLKRRKRHSIFSYNFSRKKRDIQVFHTYYTQFMQKRMFNMLTRAIYNLSNKNAQSRCKTVQKFVLTQKLHCGCI